MVSKSTFHRKVCGSNPEMVEHIGLRTGYVSPSVGPVCLAGPPFVRAFGDADGPGKSPRLGRLPTLSVAWPRLRLNGTG